MTYIKTAALVLITAMILALILFYASTMTAIQTTKDNTQRVLDSFVMHNSREIFHSIKQGNDLNESFDESMFTKSYLDELSLNVSDGFLLSNTPDGNVVYKMTIPQVTYTIDNTLNLTAYYKMHIPINFASSHSFDIMVPIRVKSRYQIKI
ncbi:hypothetical protein RBG61_12925 [Paludicola sp. MB14-C6]|uniref:hypothetical protein n=1 Tax=Paludihabitans sp. MB14-C6 TaxID=3070656 RepID=UPI0027DB8BC9|nr:hypothetical protein [Paludicola sp. MB14-C6]WMJ22879.1 hypothetical protein RBG61_12925 [Paludicola sp. MB14-C6]